MDFQPKELSTGNEHLSNITTKETSAGLWIDPKEVA